MIRGQQWETLEMAMAHAHAVRLFDAVKSVIQGVRSINIRLFGWGPSIEQEGNVSWTLDHHPLLHRRRQPI
jgi:hypothetical protein